MRAAASKRRVAGALVLLAALIAVLATQVPWGRSPERAVTTLLWKAWFRVVPPADAAAMARLHLEAETGSREQCVSCHGDKLHSKLLVHRIHLTSDLFPELACHECHRRVELGSRSATRAPEWVDVSLCKECHSAFPGLRAGSGMKPTDFEKDCTSCHRGKRAPRHDKPYLSREIPAAECPGCHGGRVLPWTPRHERTDWMRTHGTEALESGTEACFACHDFGLTFCDDCHTKKPPSHLPADRWRDVHVERARAETRACYTCHKTSWCKGCHVDHEQGWLVTHRDFVRANGKGSCTECHSLSACTFCHGAPDGGAGGMPGEAFTQP